MAARPRRRSIICSRRASARIGIVVDAAEIWHFYAGAPLVLSVKTPAALSVHRLGADLLAGEVPQVIVPAYMWQSAESAGTWTLVGCTVAPGFEFSGFEIAPQGWQP